MLFAFAEAQRWFCLLSGGSGLFLLESGTNRGGWRVLPVSQCDLRRTPFFPSPMTYSNIENMYLKTKWNYEACCLDL